MVWSLPIELYPHSWSPKFLFTLSQTLEWKFVLLFLANTRKLIFIAYLRIYSACMLIDLQKISLHIKCLLKYYFLQNTAFRMIAAGYLPSATGLCSVTLTLCFHQSHARCSIVSAVIYLWDARSYLSWGVCIPSVKNSALREGQI